MTNDERNGVKSLIERVVKLDVVIKERTLKQVWAKALVNGRHLGYFNSGVCEGIYYIIDNGDFFFIDVLNLNNAMVFGLIPKGKDQVIERSYNHYHVRFTLKEIANILTLIESLPVRSNNTDTVVSNSPIHRPLKDIVEIDVQTDHDRDNPYHLRVMGERSTDIRVRCDINIDRLNDPTPIVFTKPDLPNHVWTMGLTSWPIGSDEFEELLARINDVVRDYHKEHLAKMKAQEQQLLKTRVQIQSAEGQNSDYIIKVEGDPDDMLLTCFLDIRRLNDPKPIVFIISNLPEALVIGSNLNPEELNKVLNELNVKVRAFHATWMDKINAIEKSDFPMRYKEEINEDNPSIPHDFFKVPLEDITNMKPIFKLTEPSVLNVKCEISSILPEGYIINGHKTNEDTLLITCIVSEKRLTQMAVFNLPQSEISSVVKDLFTLSPEATIIARSHVNDQINGWIQNPPLTVKESVKKEVKSMIKRLKRNYKDLG